MAELTVRELGLSDYADTWREMRCVTEARDEVSRDELWLLEHPSVYTLGQAGRSEHLLDAGAIPIVNSDRGGQVTYHGPGQLMIYPLIDLKRNKLGVRDLVTALEQCIVDMAAEFGIEAAARPDAPGVYVEGRKLASVGLRVRRGASYHGMALNVDVDLEPFSRINPCGYSDLELTDLRRLGIDNSMQDVTERVLQHLLTHLGMTAA